MDTKKVIFVIVGLAVLIIVASLILRFYQTPKTKSSTTPTPFSTAVSKPAQVKPNEVKPTATPISHPVPVTTRVLRGTITTVSGSNISVSVSGKVESLSLATINDVYRLTGGTIEGGDAKTTPAKVADIKAGQEVLVIADKDSPAVQRVVIIK